MRLIGRITPALMFALVVTACATRMPVTDVPAGTYVLVEPASDTYNAVTISDRAFAARMGNMVHSGQHWLDSDGRIHMADDAGPCAGVESIWTYQYTNNRVTLNLVEDLCTVRPNPFPQRMVYQRN